MSNKFPQIIKSEGSILVEFINSNCEPCAMIEPTLLQIKKSIGNRIEILVVEVDEVPEVVNLYNIDSVPTTALFQNGELIWKTAEVLSKQKLLEKILDIV
ncbi:thioredoxin family protein [Flavobacterium sp. N2270]|uniref:thioredoxin family protein n=1 Tax=Flavobacterium sp. N2270 TaxID=2986831 RepID=UPI0022258CA1|nr:thioredoxin family protein [Flavobacterium sp. N2270]